VKKISKKEMQQALEAYTRWDSLSNKVLYDLCKKYPKHKKENVIQAKMLIIGRVYAASIERRKIKKEMDTASFWTKEVVPKIKESEIDSWISNLNDNLTKENIPNILRVHNDVTYLFKKISGQEKISLASKYLHFHNPKLFFIYDSIICKNIPEAERRLSSNNKEEIKKILSKLPKKIDTSYASYAYVFVHLFFLKKRMEKQLGRKITLRELDTILYSM